MSRLLLVQTVTDSRHYLQAPDELYEKVAATDRAEIVTSTATKLRTINRPIEAGSNKICIYKSL